jgi:hypothetical protein
MLQPPRSSSAEADRQQLPVSFKNAETGINNMVIP